MQCVNESPVKMDGDFCVFVACEKKALSTRVKVW